MNSTPMAQSLWLYIIHNQPHSLGLAPTSAYTSLFHPLFETQIQYLTSQVWTITNMTNTEIEQILLNHYNQLISSNTFHPGWYGDWIKVTALELLGNRYLTLDFIAHAAWIKPTLAADLGIFVKNRSDFFFVGVIRKNPPGQGTPAILGGIMNAGSVLDSGLYTMLKEVKEEANFSITYSGDLVKLREDYSNSPISVIVHGFEKLNTKLKDLKATIQYIITLPTSTQEINLDGTKRVYLAIAYAILIDVGDLPLSTENLNQIFTAGDDAQEIYVQNVSLCFTSSDFSLIPPFGLHHHSSLFKAMVNFYRRS
jgi:hypothetical protein